MRKDSKRDCRIANVWIIRQPVGHNYPAGSALWLLRYVVPTTG